MSEYAPQFNRLSKCLRCQSGLEENPALNLTVNDRATKKTVCSEFALPDIAAQQQMLQHTSLR
jgi:hypothetical protein